MTAASERVRQTDPTRQVGIVPHTHWDREWYAPFQRYRVQLVHLVDDLLDLLEADPSFTRFLLDGQTAVIDDYLAVRPEAEPRLRALAGAGRLQVGPWMILMDEFMVSGETIVRNLQHGLARAAALGGDAAMRVGYLPDMFGHIAQMPQLLRLAGLEHAVVWRGRAVGDRPDRVLVARPRRLDRARRVPLRLVLERARHPEGPGAARRPRPRLRRRARRGRAARWRHAPHERLRPPAPPAVARRRGGRGQRPPGRVPLRGHVARRVRARAAHRRPRPRGTASCAPAHAPTCSWAWRRTGSTCTSSRPTPSAASSATPNRCRRCCSRRPTTPPRCSTSDGVSWCSTARTTRRARAAPTTWSRRCGCATRRRATSARRSRARRCARSPPPSTSRRRRPSS